MTAIEKMMVDLDPETMIRQVMNDPNHKARVRARTERERKAHQTKTERELAACKAKHKKEMSEFRKFHERYGQIMAEQVTKVVAEKDATTVAIGVFALFAGYCLAFV